MPTMVDEHFEYLVIGGGSGGIASARRAAAHGAKVGVVERDRLGGTCVNVGCVPKKVMFMAGSMQEMLHQSAGYGFSVDGVSFDMKVLKEKRDAYVKRLNGIYLNNLDNSGITSITGDAVFVGPKEIKVGDKTYSGDNVLIAVGGRPLMPDIPGIELGINSNDFFDLETIPKRVCVVGSGYIAVELAGILQLLGSKVDLCIRGDRPLKTMDPDVVDLLVEEMSETGITWVRGEVEAIAEAADGTKTCTLKGGEEHGGYDEVLFAIGRVPTTQSLNLPAAGVDTTSRGEIVVDKATRTSADGVYAVGDIITGAVQLTPVAIAAGRLLSDRLFAGMPEAETCMDYDNIPTVVFSHPTMAVMGLTEAEAIKRHGADAVTCHKTTFVNMLYSREFLVEGQHQPKTRAKLVCVGPEQRIVGLHMIGLNVDEMLQGFGVALKMGATKADFDSVVAIHPTSSEELVTIAPWQAKYSNVPSKEAASVA
uniref:Glutathione reductase n=1 Tax=Haptolina brevifila TaxID=156173 RepID=A0A7S2HUA9_9EUKA